MRGYRLGALLMLASVSGAGGLCLLCTPKVNSRIATPSSPRPPFLVRSSLTALQPVEMVGPPLHELDALRPILRPVVGAADLVVVLAPSEASITSERKPVSFKMELALDRKPCAVISSWV